MCLKAFVDSSVNKRRLAIEELSSKISEAVLSSPSHVGLPVGLGVPSLIKCHDITFNTNHELSHTFIGSCFAESHFSLHELAELSHEFGLDGKLGDDNVDHVRFYFFFFVLSRILEDLVGGSAPHQEVGKTTSGGNKPSRSSLDKENTFGRACRTNGDLYIDSV